MLLFPEEGNVVRADDCIYIKHMKAGDKTVPRGMYDFMTLRLHESYERDCRREANQLTTVMKEFVPS